MSTTRSPDGVKPESPWPLVVLLVSVLAVWFVSAIVIDRHIPSSAQDAEAKRGQFGDKFGAVNSLFSGLAFACLVYATFLQRRELALQREELGYTREELKLTRQETAAQTALFAQQLDAMKQSHEFAVQRELLAEDAKIVPQKGSINEDDSVSVNLVNCGARVFSVSVEPEGDDVEIKNVTRKTTWENDQQLTFRIVPKNEIPAQLYFTVNYETASRQK